MAKTDIRERLGKKFVVFDGGFGSQLQARGVPAGTNSGEINIDRADLVKAIHKDYIDAGFGPLKDKTMEENLITVVTYEDYQNLKK